MGLPSNTNALQNGFAQGYQIGRSLRFRSSASAYLNRTPASTTNQKTFTYSAWVKLGNLSQYQSIFSQATNGNNEFEIQLSSSTSQIQIYDYQSAYSLLLTTSQVLRDPSAWYHILVAIDTTQSTASNRAKLYINGVQVTAFGTATYPSQNYNTMVNLSTAPARIGSLASGSSSYYLDGYLAEVNFVDGQALTPSSFGVYDSNGIWQPIKYAGTYGTNGFYLPFSNTTSTTTLVADASGNGNNWTANNISLTAGTTYDSMIDSPTNSNAAANYAVLNPLTNGSYTTLSGGNLNTSGNTITNNGNSRSSFAFTTGKWYAEFTVTGVNSTYPQYGIMQSSDAQSPNNALPQAGYGSILNSVAYRADGTKVIANTSSAYGSSFTTNDVIGIAIDADNGAVYFSKNGTFQNSGVPTSGSSKTGAALTWTGSSVELVIAIAEYNGSGTATNFGQRPFTYTPPSGYNALNTANLPQPLISNGANYMAATLYTGNGTSQSINNSVNGVSFQPDFVWYKDRSVARDHALFNVTSGATYLMSSNNTSAESAVAGTLTSFNSNGYSIGSAANANANGETYVGWQWKAGGTGVTNTSGSITSTVSANTTAGFSVVTYTGTGANATVGHGLGVAPSMIIVKQRGAGGTNWNVYHVSTGNTGAMYLDLTNVFAADSTRWNNTSPTSTVFTVGTGGGVNANSGTFVAYCFAAVRGYSAMGSYTGNGSSDGPMVYLGFKPRWIMMKCSTTAGLDWNIVDTSRNLYNVTTSRLWADLSNAEDSTDNVCDILSNGFKLRSTNTNTNASGATFIYLAFAESPFQIARAR